MKKYCCEICGEINPEKFYVGNKSKCKICMSKQNTERIKKNKSCKSGLSKTKQRVRIKKIQSSGRIALYKIKKRSAGIKSLIRVALKPRKIAEHNLQTFIQTVVLNHGNIYGFNKTVYVDAPTPVTVTCLKHNYDFSVSAAALLRRTERNGGPKKNPIVGSCPICRIEYFNKIKKETINKFRIVHNNEYEYDESTYINSKIPFTAICPVHGSFQILGENHINGGNKCPKCYSSKGMDIRNEKWIGDKRYYICEIHGDVLIGKHRSLSDGCPKCCEERQKIINDESLGNRLYKKYGNDYDIIIDDVNVVFVCKKHGIKRILTRKEMIKHNNRTYFCTECLNDYNQAVKDTARKDTEIKVKKIIADEYSNIYEYIEIIYNGNIDKSKIRLLNILTNKEKIVEIKTILRHELSKNYRYALRNYLSYEEAKAKVRQLGITSFREYKKWYIRTQQTELPTNPQREYLGKGWISYCDFFGTNPKTNMSWGEKRIDEHLKRKNLEFVWQKRFVDCRDKMPLPFDFYLPEYNLIIEFDGDQHYRKTEKFGKNGGFETIQKHDKIKNEYCEKNNIHLLRLTYDDLIHNVLEWSIDMKLSKIFVNQLLVK